MKKDIITFAQQTETNLFTSKKAAFTLAEVLITLGIIGVVAAMTMPVLINKHKEQVTVSKVKKFYSTMGQALNFAINENGSTVDGWTYDTETETDSSYADSNSLVSMFKPHLKILKDCGTESGCLYDGNPKYLNGELHNANYDKSNTYYALILNDGTSMWFRRSQKTATPCTGTDLGHTNLCGAVWIDVNGKNSPNTIGRDIFAFAILKDRIAPVKIDDCNLNGHGWGCSAYILTNGNMNYLHE